MPALKGNSFKYYLLKRWRRIRIVRLLTRVLGPQYRRSRGRIEIDITYSCNLHCVNCNRSVSQAPEDLHISIVRVRRFVDESIGSGKRWERIRVLGGEPTLHPLFPEVMDEFLRYLRWNADCIVEVVTNGHGPDVLSRLYTLPSSIRIENSCKESELQPTFRPFNDAPVDDEEYNDADFANGCEIMHKCGMGLTPLGYYPCAIAGGIDRITGYGLGRRQLPDDADDMIAEIRRFCRLCGRFRDGYLIPDNLRPPLEGAVISPTWESLYRQWRQKRSHLPAIYEQANQPARIFAGDRKLRSEAKPAHGMSK